MAALQVLQRGICDQGAVVQLDHLQTVVSTGATAEVSDAIISNQLTVGQTLQERYGSNAKLVFITKQFMKTALTLCLNMLQEQHMLGGKPTLTRTCKRGQWIDSWMSVPSVI